MKKIAYILLLGACPLIFNAKVLADKEKENFQSIAEKRGHAQLLHKGIGELREGIAQDDHLGDVPQVVQELFRPGQRVDLRDGFLYLLKAQSVLLKRFDAEIHQLAVIRFVARGAGQLRNAGLFRKCDPYFRDDHAFHIEAYYVEI